jgi:hypothetical protein
MIVVKSTKNLKKVFLKNKKLSITDSFCFTPEIHQQPKSESHTQNQT